MKTIHTICLALLLLGTPWSSAAPDSSYKACNTVATAMLESALSNTVRVSIYLNGANHYLTTDERNELQALLQGAKSSTPGCAPEGCLYLNLDDADGNWLMSLPVLKTDKGIVLLYLKLKGDNAGEPLQRWWKNVINRIQS